MKDHLSTLPQDYLQTFESIKNRIYEAKAKVVKSINKEHTQFYWDTGKILHEKLQTETWGKSVVQRMSQDLQLEFPEMKGIKPSDLWRARSFYEQYGNYEKLVQLEQELLFNHNLRIFERVEDEKAGEFYLTMAAQNFWSRIELERRIKKYKDENPSIGIIICKSKDKTMVEFALQNTKVPVGVATYSYKTLTEQIAKYLPSKQEIIESVEGFEE